MVARVDFLREPLVLFQRQNELKALGKIRAHKALYVLDQAILPRILPSETTLVPY